MSYTTVTLSIVTLLCVLLSYRSAIFSLLLVTDNIVATGDDEGSLKVDAIPISSVSIKISQTLANLMYTHPALYSRPFFHELLHR